jgi:NADH:ubiquinone oxidoreductase subunit 5 (subunit L)/multisubunit Na+/H+ antiporter MnhA subunit
MIKIPVYSLIRFLSLLSIPQQEWGILFLIIGIITALLGIIYALKESILKRMLAYSSIENIGIIFTGLGLYLVFSAGQQNSTAMLALAGTVFHVINHAFFKTLLFLGAGAIIIETNTKNIEDLGGLIKPMPYTAVFFLIGSLAISGLPPFNGFVSELMLFLAFFQTNALESATLKGLLIVCMAAFGLTSALVSACFVKVFGTIFLGVARSDKAKVIERVPWLMRIGQGILAAGCILLGLLAYYLFVFLGYSFPVPIPNLLVVGLVIVIVSLGVVGTIYKTGSRQKRSGEPWGCGIPFLSSKTQYSAMGFSEPIVTIFRTIYRTKKQSKVQYFDRREAIVQGGHAEIKLIKFFEEYLYMPVVRLISRISVLIARLENDNSNTYVLYVFLIVLFIFILLG